MKFAATLLVLVTLPALVFAQSPKIAHVIVTESIEDRPDDQVRHAAKVKAAFAGVDRLPVVIKGKETLTNDEFNVFVNALGAGYVDVKTTREDWDREKGLLTLTADVSLDAAKTEEALSKITELEHTKKQLRKAYAVMDAALSKSLVSPAELAKIDLMQKGVTTGIAVRQSVLESMQAKESLIRSVAKSLRVSQQVALADYKIEIVDATPGGLKVLASGPSNIDMKRLLEEAGLFAFYSANKKDIDDAAGQICLQAFRYRWSFEDKPATPENYFNKDSIEAHYFDYRNKVEKVGTQYAVMQVRPYPVNQIVNIRDGSDYSVEYYDMVLQRPDKFLKMGICVDH